MKDRQVLWDHFDLPGEQLPGQVLVEITGKNRVLIEHHRGVRAYSRERIIIRVKFGQVEILGSDLELKCMTREQLVISGVIKGVELKGRDEG